MLRFHIITLFPEMFAGPFDSSILRRARDRGLISIGLYNIRDYTHDKHHVVDDYPYGGGSGMVMKPEPLVEAVEGVLTRIEEERPGANRPVVLMSPQGRLFTQRTAERWAQEEDLVLVCGHYEGVDERVRQCVVTDEVSVGDYILTGGDLPAMVVVDAVSRLVPGVLNSPDSLREESHSMGLLEYPQYTRPADFRGHRVPDVLLSGNHQWIDWWRREQSLLRTWRRRPDLLEPTVLDEHDKRFLEQLMEDEGIHYGRTTPHSGPGEPQH